MVLKGGVVENTRGEKEEELELFDCFLDKRIGRVRNICDRKP
jgi:hypothetical protein